MLWKSYVVPIVGTYGKHVILRGPPLFRRFVLAPIEQRTDTVVCAILKIRSFL
jgi:hypothetical protein